MASAIIFRVRRLLFAIGSSVFVGSLLVLPLARLLGSLPADLRCLCCRRERSAPRLVRLLQDYSADAFAMPVLPAQQLVAGLAFVAGFPLLAG